MTARRTLAMRPAPKPIGRDRHRAYPDPTTDTHRAYQGGPWMDDAACLGMDVNTFDPACYDLRYGKDQANTTALDICAACPVRQQCLEANIEDRWLIVGGTTPDERARLRRNGNRKSQAKEIV